MAVTVLHNDPAPAPDPLHTSPRHEALGTLAAVALPALVMAALGLWGLDRNAVWRDEGVTLEMAYRSLPQIAHLASHIDAVHGLYYALMHFVLAPGPGETLLRLPSVLGATVAAGLVGLLGTRLARPRVGLWAGLLFAVTPFVGRYAQEGRSYALVAAGALAATLALVRAVQGGGRRRWLLYALSTAGTAWLHELSVLVLAAHACTLCCTRAPWRVWRAWLAVAACVLVSLVPLVHLSRTQSAQVGWLGKPGREQVRGLIEAFAGPAEGVCAVVLALAVVGACARTPHPGRVSLRAVALPLAVVPPALLLGVSRYEPLYYDRYVLFCLAGVPLLAAAGADRIVCLLPAGRSPRTSGAHGLLAAGGAALACVAFAAQLPVYAHERGPHARPDDLTGIAVLAARELEPGSALLFQPSPNARRAAAAYPAAFHRPYDVALARSGARAGQLYSQETDAATLARRLRSVDRVWMVVDSRALRPGWTPWGEAERTKADILRRHFVLREEHAARSGVLRLYERRSAATARTQRVPR
ncbi:glycosyltransferase family 39 protein [Streptomyces sp. NPDC016845]|uniref:glycosyltransferase family 39 protein n=1 Tax=Streptomyces sp. NPDC016845 TaxID=3364972 RepID=UPI00379A6D15